MDTFLVKERWKWIFLIPICFYQLIKVKIVIK